MNTPDKPLRPTSPVHFNPFQPLQIKLIFCHLLTGTGTWGDTGLSEPFWRLYWNPTDGARVRLGKKCIELTPATVALIAPHTPYDKEADRAVEHFHMHFFAGTVFNEIRNVMFEFELPGHVRDEMETIIALLYRSEVKNLQFLMLTNSVLFWALNRMSAQIPSPVTVNPRIQELCTHIDANFRHSLSNDSLAARVSMNTNAFITLFRNVTGLTPRQYIMHKRVEEACTLLAFSDKSIETVAGEVGFCGRNYFTQVFHKIIGLGPAGYKKTRMGSRFD